MQSSGSSELVEEGDCIGYRKNLEFKPLTNFTFKFLYKVTTPSNLVDLSGFLVEVSQTIQDEQITGECFIPWHKSQMAGTSLTKELSPALPESATLGSKLSPSQIRELFWMKLEEFHNDPDVARNVKRAVSTLGRQLNSDVFVFGPHVQLDVDGNVTPLTEQQFIWVQKIVERFSVLPSTPIISTLPQCTNPMKFLVKGMRMLTQENFISGVLVLGAIMISLFHEDILRKFGNSGVAIAVGKMNRGKSKSVELSLAAVGCRGAKFAEISDALLRKLLLGAMPWCFDDPSDAEQLQRILIAAFGGANTGNMTSHGTARVAPIVTVNDFVLDDLASMDER